MSKVSADLQYKELMHASKRFYRATLKVSERLVKEAEERRKKKSPEFNPSQRLTQFLDQLLDANSNVFASHVTINLNKIHTKLIVDVVVEFTSTRARLKCLSRWKAKSFAPFVLVRFRVSLPCSHRRCSTKMKL
jgi:hypothetical protein